MHGTERENTCTDLRVVSYDVIEASQKAQTSTNLHMHGSIHIVEEVQGFVD